MEALPDLVNKVIGGHINRSVEAILMGWDGAVTADEAITLLTTLRQDLALVHEVHAAKSDIHFREVALQETVADIHRIETEDGITGLPYPWPVMNEHTGGLQPGDLALIWALPKSKKTWIGLYMIVHLFERGYRVMVYSKEMSWDNMRRRIACILGGVSYSKYKKGLLDEQEKAAILEQMDVLTAPWHGGELIFTDCDLPDGSVGGPNEIREKIETYRADAVFADSSYMLQVPGVKDAMDWKAIAAVTRGLKQVAKTTLVPIIAIMQENEKAALKHRNSRGTASVAMYSGMVMDCDIGIRIVNNQRLNQTSLIFAACRETDFPGFTINTLLCEDFSHIPGAALFDITCNDVTGDEGEPDNDAVNAARAADTEFGADGAGRGRRSLIGVMRAGLCRVS